MRPHATPSDRLRSAARIALLLALAACARTAAALTAEEFEARLG
jgi:hypothetical protein